MHLSLTVITMVGIIIISCRANSSYSCYLSHHRWCPPRHDYWHPKYWKTHLAWDDFIACRRSCRTRGARAPHLNFLGVGSRPPHENCSA